MIRVAFASVVMIILAAMEPFVGSYAWGVHHPFPFWIHKAGAGAVLLAYAVILMMLVSDARAQVRRWTLAVGVPVLVFGLFAGAWATYYVIKGWVPYTLLLWWATCVVVVQGVALSGVIGRRGRYNASAGGAG